MYDLERYLNVRSAYGASVGPDGRVAFLYDATGVPQVWELSEPGAWPEQRTFHEEQVRFVDHSPTRPELVFGMDEGGDERMQFHLLDDDGRETALTDRPDAKHRWGGWREDGEAFAFAANRRDESVFDVYVQGRDDDEADLVAEGDGWLSLNGFSPDGDRLLVTRSHSSFDQDLYVQPVDGGDRLHLTPHDEDTRFLSASWSPDGDAVYLATDAGNDTLRLARIPVPDRGSADGESADGDADTGERDVERNADGIPVTDGVVAPETVVDGGEWNVDGVAVDRGTGRLVYSRNVDGYTELTVGVLEGPTTVETLAEPTLADGVAGGVAWGPEGDRFACSASSRTDNTNVHLVGATTGESERFTHASTAGVPRETFVEPELVRYETFDGRSIPAFLSTPDDPPAEGAPVIVDVHGGPESQRRPSFAGLTQYFLSRGYAVLEPNVRGSTGYGKAYTHLDDVEQRLDAVADVAAGVEWLGDREGIDTDRAVAMGGSYGGFVVLSAMTEYPDLWAAGVDVVGIASFVTFLENTGSWRRSLREAEYGSLAEDRDFLESISPINNVDAIAAPLFVLHGANDPRVPVGEAERIAAEASEHVPVETLIFEDEGHGITKRENRIEAYTRVVDFLDRHV